MRDAAKKALVRITAASMRKCAEKLSRFSAASWEMTAVDISLGSLEAALARYSSDDAVSEAIYFDVKGDLPFMVILLLDPRDAEMITGSFYDRAMYPAPRMSGAGDLFLQDMGSVILNSFVGALSDALGRAFMPSVPRVVRGDPRFLVEAMEVLTGAARCKRIVHAELALKRAQSVVRMEMLGLIPDGLEQEILAHEKE